MALLTTDKIHVEEKKGYVLLLLSIDSIDRPFEVKTMRLFLSYYGFIRLALQD